MKRYAIEQAQSEGFTGDLAEDFVEGFVEGWAQQGIEIAKNALQMGMTIEDIARLTGLAHDEIEQLKN